MQFRTNSAGSPSVLTPTRMKRIRYTLLTVFVLLTVTGFIPRTAEPPTYTLDKSHTQILFKVQHMGISTVTGRFNDFDATITVDPANLSTFATRATINTSSIDTGNTRRDDHLRGTDFFDAAGHPQITFISREVRNVDGAKFQVLGDLTMRGVTKPVVLDVTFSGTARDMQGKNRVAFVAEGKINRTDYGLVWNRVIEAGGQLVSEEVTIVLEVAAVQQAA